MVGLLEAIDLATWAILIAFIQQRCFSDISHSPGRRSTINKKVFSQPFLMEEKPWRVLVKIQAFNAPK